MDGRITPPGWVLDAFGVTAPPEPLAGGRGRTWRAGDVVLKPTDGDVEGRWRSEILDRMPESSAFRIARPVRARDGDWIAGGWEASRFVAGSADPGRIDDVIRAGEVFHVELASVPRPSFLDGRSDLWTYADRLAWGEAVPDGATRRSALLGPLLDAREEIDVPAQVVHGDLLGNVLFADGLPPAIIDWPVYWRPSAWASAVVVVDAICWHDADPAVLTRWNHLPHWHQMLVRALIYRIATHQPPGREDPDSAYRPLVDHLLT